MCGMKYLEARKNEREDQHFSISITSLPHQRGDGNSILYRREMTSHDVLLFQNLPLCHDLMILLILEEID